MNRVARAAVGFVLIAAAAPTTASANDIAEKYNRPQTAGAPNVPQVPQMRTLRNVRSAIAARHAARTQAQPAALPAPRIVRTRTRPAAAEAKAAQPATRIALPIATASHPHWISVAQQYKGGNPTGRKSLWCADFLNLVLTKSGMQGTSSSTARSFASYGQRLSGPKVGAIAVLSRGKNGGHVGIVTSIDANGNPVLISGNHNNRVAEASYPNSRVIAYVWPTS